MRKYMAAVAFIAVKDITVKEFFYFVFFYNLCL